MSKASVAARNMASLRYGSESVITRLPRAARGRSQRRHGAAGRADRAWNESKARLNVALELARQRAGDDQAALDRIEREAERLNALIGQLLMLARLESGASAPAQAAVDLAGLVREVAEDAAFEARARGRRVEIVETCDDVVVGDPDLLRSAVENVVRNAVRHAPESTAVEIGLRRVGRRGAAMVRIAVRDHGSGVPEAALPHIFQAFYRVGDARARGTGGVGLGLTIVDRTIRLHGG